MFNGDVLVLDMVSYIKVPNIHMFGMLGTQLLPIFLHQDQTGVILINSSFFDQNTLFLEEVPSQQQEKNIHDISLSILL